MACTDDQHAWAVGWPDGSGTYTMRATSDGGATWPVVDVGTTERLNDVAFADSTHGWAVGYSGTVVATADGGTWAPQTSGTTSELKSVFFWDDLRGWAVGYEGTVIATIDGGVTWTPQASGGTDILAEVFFASATRGWIVDQVGSILATTDGGAHWRQNSTGAAYLNGGVLLDATHAWAFGGWGTTLALDVIRPAATATAPGGVQHIGGDGALQGHGLHSRAWPASSTASVAARGRPGRAPGSCANGTTVVSYRATDNAANTSVVKKVSGAHQPLTAQRGRHPGTAARERPRAAAARALAPPPPACIMVPLPQGPGRRRSHRPLRQALLPS